MLTSGGTALGAICEASQHVDGVVGTVVLDEDVVVPVRRDRAETALQLIPASARAAAMAAIIPAASSDERIRSVIHELGKAPSSPACRA